MCATGNRKGSSWFGVAGEGRRRQSIDESGTRITALLGDLLPYAETIDQPTPAPETPRCRDPDDQVFLDLLVATGADALVTGDGDLLAIAAQSHLPILTPAQLRETLSRE